MTIDQLIAYLQQQKQEGTSPDFGDRLVVIRMNGDDNIYDINLALCDWEHVAIDAEPDGALVLIVNEEPIGARIDPPEDL